MSIRKKISATIVCMIGISIATGCSQNLGKEYEPIEAGFLLDSSKSIAVISGHNDDNDIQLTEMVIEKLSSIGKFKVVTQAELKKQIPKYPLNVNLIDFSIGGDKDKRYTPYLSDTSKDAINAVQKIVKTDYVLVVWIDNMQSSVSQSAQGTNRSTAKYMCIMSRALSYPGGKMVGFSSRWNKDSSILGDAFSGDWEQFLKSSANNLVGKVIEKTNK